MKKTATIVLPLALLSSLAFASENDVEKRRFPGDALIVDVRTPAEFKAGHYPGAMNIPLSSIPSRISEFGPPDGTIVVYCRSGRRSGIAQRLLEQAGYQNAINGGGLRDMLRRSSLTR